jgi:hypothetical protein
LESTTGVRETEIGERGIGDEGRVVLVGVGAGRFDDSEFIFPRLELSGIGFEIFELGIIVSMLGTFSLEDDIFLQIYKI